MSLVRLGVIDWKESEDLSCGAGLKVRGRLKSLKGASPQGGHHSEVVVGISILRWRCNWVIPSRASPTTCEWRNFQQTAISKAKTAWEVTGHTQ
jgi:hypothetical protein